MNSSHTVLFLGLRFAGSDASYRAALEAAGGNAELIVLEEHHHAATALALGDENSPLTKAMLKLILGKRP